MGTPYLIPFAPSESCQNESSRVSPFSFPGAGDGARIASQVGGVVPEAQERVLAGAELDEVERALVLRPAQAVLRDGGAGERGAEDAQRRLVGHGEDGLRRAFVARADLLQHG